MPCTVSNVLAILIMYPIGAVLVVNALVIVGILFQEISQANYERDRKKGVDRLLGVKPSQFVEYQDDMRRAARGTAHASSRLSRLIDLNRRGLAVALLVVGFVGGLVHSYQMCFVA